MDAPGRRRGPALRAAAVADRRGAGDGRDARGGRAAGGPPARPAPAAALAELAATGRAAVQARDRRPFRGPVPFRGPAPFRASGDGVPAAPLAERHGSSSLAGLVRRGLLRAEVRERPRRPLAGRPAPTRGARPEGAALTADQAAAAPPRAGRRRGAAIPRPILLDGVTGGGKTAIYVEAIAASLAAGRPALLLVPEIALATPIVDRLRAELGVRIAVLHSGLGEGERADEWRRIRAGEADLVVGTRTALLAPLADVGPGRGRRGARRGLQERPHAALPGARRGDRARPARRGRRRAGLRDARRWRRWATRGPGATGGRSSPCGPPARSRS